jgi:hypothetical protein
MYGMEGDEDFPLLKFNQLRSHNEDDISADRDFRFVLVDTVYFLFSNLDWVSVAHDYGTQDDSDFELHASSRAC